MCWKKYKVYRAILFYPIFAVQPIMAQTDSLFLTVEQLFEKGVQHNLQLQADIMKESMARSGQRLHGLRNFRNYKLA